MATRNISGDGKKKMYEQLVCSEGLFAGIHGQLAFISVLNIVLFIATFLGNALILAALRKESSLRPPPKLLLRSLATTDLELCVGLISQPLAVGIWLSVVNKKWNICRWILAARFITDYILCGVSLCTVTAISVDRLLALLLGLRYRQFVTLKRTYAFVITFWVVSTVFSTMQFLKAVIMKWYSIIGIFGCLVTLSFSYTKIFLTVRHRQNQRIRNTFHNRLYFVWSVSVDTDCNKREQTSRTVVGAEIQTSCNFEANLRHRYYLLGCVFRLFNNALFRCPYNQMV